MHWVQVNLQVSLGVSALHVIVTLIMKLHSHSSSKEEVITAIEDNRSKIVLVQTKDVDEVK